MPALESSNSKLLKKKKEVQKQKIVLMTFVTLDIPGVTYLLLSLFKGKDH